MHDIDNYYPFEDDESQIKEFKYFEEHPEERHERANTLVNKALLKAWPKKRR